MNSIPPLSMVGLDTTNQRFNPALLPKFYIMPTKADEILACDQVWVVGSSPTMESWGV